MSEEKLPFFVYGTLLPRQPNAYLWGDSVVNLGDAALAGCNLYDMGAYPMLVEEGVGEVVGMVNTVAEADYEAVMARLDRLEGYDPMQPDQIRYRRVVREVQVINASSEHGQSSRSLKVWVYIGHPTAVADLKPIPGGDWAAYSAKTFQDIDQWWRDVASVHHLPED